MKSKMIILAVALIVSAFVLIGCTAASDGTAQYSGNGRHGIENRAADNTSHGGYGRQNADVTEKVDAEEAAVDVSETQLPKDTAAAAISSDITADLAGFGSAGALSDNDLTLADMLTYALQDEYLAHAEYVLIIDDFGNAKPFSNIINAEENHISQLLPLFETYGIAVPENNADSHTVNVTNLTEAYSSGETAELSNIAMYDIFLKQDLQDDVRTVFESLKGASENHLAAFRKHL